MHAHLPDDKLATIADSLFAARKIEAIKTYRDLTGLGLKEAKDAVEEIEGALRRDFPEKFTRPSPRAGCLGTAALFALCLCGVTGWLLLA